MKSVKPLLAATCFLAVMTAMPANAAGTCVQSKLSDCRASFMDRTDSTTAYAAAMQRMHRGMMIQHTGDADADFVAGMIPHHQGAIDMAKVVLQHGHDQKIRRLAQGIIKAQEKEIEMMKRWQAEHARNGTKAKAAKPGKAKPKAAAEHGQRHD